MIGETDRVVCLVVGCWCWSLKKLHHDKSASQNVARSVALRFLRTFGIPGSSRLGCRSATTLVRSRFVGPKANIKTRHTKGVLSLCASAKMRRGEFFLVCLMSCSLQSSPAQKVAEMNMEFLAKMAMMFSFQ